jgi:hypothetical protein
MKLTGFVIAVRYNRCFSIEDNLGSIIDDILTHQSKYFDEKFFEEIKHFYNTKMLVSSMGHKMTISIDNILFEYETQKDFSSEFDKFLHAYDKVILNYIFKEYNIQKINRFGCIFKCQLDEGNDVFNAVNKIIEDKNRNVESISFRYNKTSKKPLEIEGEIRSDFENEIVTYDKPTVDKKINFFVDYQRYFNPPYKYIQDVKPGFDNFVTNSYKHFQENYKSNVIEKIQKK